MNLLYLKLYDLFVYNTCACACMYVHVFVCLSAYLSVHESMYCFVYSISIIDLKLVAHSPHTEWKSIVSQGQANQATYLTIIILCTNI